MNDTATTKAVEVAAKNEVVHSCTYCLGLILKTDGCTDLLNLSEDGKITYGDASAVGQKFCNIDCFYYWES